MFYINQIRTPSFPTGLVKTESGLIVIETGLGWWTLVVSVISVDAYPFFGFLRTDLVYLEVTGIGKFIISASV